MLSLPVLAKFVYVDIGWIVNPGWYGNFLCQIKRVYYCVRPTEANVFYINLIFKCMICFFLKWLSVCLDKKLQTV